MLRPGRHQQAEAIVNSLRSKPARAALQLPKKARKGIRKASKPHSPAELDSDGSFRIARHKNGTQSRVFIRVLQTPPRSPRPEVEGHAVAATIKSVISRLLKPRLVTENLLEELRVANGKISLDPPGGESAAERSEQKVQSGDSSARTDSSMRFDRAKLDRIKIRFNIEYLY